MRVSKSGASILREAAEGIQPVYSVALPTGRAAMYSARSPAKETTNEDAAAIVPCGPHAAVLIVADGVGGQRSGEHASRTTIQVLEETLIAAVKDGMPLRGAILDGIERANHEVLTAGLGSAATLVVVEIDGDTVRPFHVGDCMCLVLGQRGRIKWQTISHSPVGFAVEAGLMDDEEAMHHEDRHLVSNVIGAADMRIEIGPTLTLARYDTLLVSSDGLLDNLHLGEIVEDVRKGPVDAGAQRLAEACSQRMTTPEEGAPSKPDDLTFILYRRVRAMVAAKKQASE